MDPAEMTEWLQTMSVNNMPGFNRGMFAPQSTGGASLLSMTSAQGFQGGYAPSIAGNIMPDVSPLAPLNLGQFGVLGMLGGIAINTPLTQMIEAQGMMPMGNAGSYMQAQRTREHRLMQSALTAKVAGNDAAGYFRTMRGLARLTGQPFNAKQRDAAHDLSNTLASMSPMLAMHNPELLDAVAGEQGSVQALTAQMSEANRYRLDPMTGQMGYSTESNKDLIDGVFKNMFSKDNMAKMHGLRAGDVGQMYRGLAAEGLTGTRGSLRDRTLAMLKETRDEGGSLQKLGASAGVGLADDVNLETISNVDLTKLRENKDVRSKLSSSDAKQISNQLQGYVDSISAMREVFGENGDLSAPVPKLINALKALSSGQMQRFNPGQLNNMVREVQALSQLSGKSVDQIVAMTQSAGAMNNALVGPAHGLHFTQAAVNIGTTTGMALRHIGAPVGIGADSVEQTEKTAMSLASRGVASELGNVLGLFNRLDQAGGFDQNTVAGKDLKSILAAANAGKTQYKDTAGKMQDIPMREIEYLQLAQAGGVAGLSGAAVADMLGTQTTSNLLGLAGGSQGLKQTPFNLQRMDISRVMSQAISSRLLSNDTFANVKDPAQKTDLTNALGSAATEALHSLSPSQMADKGVRNKMVAAAITKAALDRNHTLDPTVALNLAESAAGTAETVTEGAGLHSLAAYSAIYGEPVAVERMRAADTTYYRSMLNQAMSPLGKQGSITQRVFTALQAQGKDKSTDLTKTLAAVLGVGPSTATAELAAAAKEITSQTEALQTQEGVLRQTTDPAARDKIKIEMDAKVAELNKATAAYTQLLVDNKMAEDPGKYDKADVIEGQKAGADLRKASELSVAQFKAATSVISPAEREAAAKTTLTEADIKVWGAFNQAAKLKEIDALSEADLTPAERKIYGANRANNLPTKDAMAPIQAQRRNQLKSEEDAEKKVLASYVGKPVGDLESIPLQDTIERERRVAKVKSDGGANSVPQYTENDRKAVQAWIATSPSGREAADNVTQDLERMDSVRSQYLADKDMVKLGGKAGIDAANVSRESAEELRRLADKYYDRDSAAALLAGGSGLSDAGKNKAAVEFQAMTPEQEQAIRARRTEAKRPIVGKVTIEDFREDIGLQAQAAVIRMDQAAKDMSAALVAPAGAAPTKPVDGAAPTKPATEADLTPEAQAAVKANEEYNRTHLAGSKAVTGQSATASAAADRPIDITGTLELTGLIKGQGKITGTTGAAEKSVTKAPGSVSETELGRNTENPEFDFVSQMYSRLVSTVAGAPPIKAGTEADRTLTVTGIVDVRGDMVGQASFSSITGVLNT